MHLSGEMTIYLGNYKHLIKQNSGEYLASVLLVEFLRSVTANELNIDMKSVDQLFRLSI